MRSIIPVLMVGSLLASPACVTTTTRTMYAGAPYGQEQERTRQGRVEWIRQTVHEAQGNPAAGAAAGAVIGGLLGGLITGHRSGALFGAASGAMLGASASEVHGEYATYDVAVRFRDGETRVFAYRGYPPFRPGQSVRLTDRGLVPIGAFAVSSPYGTTSPPGSPEPQADAADVPVQPSAPQPGAAPPVPPPAAPAPPAGYAEAEPAEAPTGQWVFTRQYGWLWMPYSPAYTFTPDYERGDPYMYVYYPAAGWTWVNAPWLWGWGPMPYVGISGGVNFVWYGHGWGDGWRGRRPARYRSWRRR